MAWVERHGGKWRVRYPTGDGTLASDSGFPTKTAAQERAKDIDFRLRHPEPKEQRANRMSLSEWIEVWSQAHDVSRGTWAKYRSHLRNHVEPRFGGSALSDISRMQVKGWVKSLRTRLAPATVTDVVTLLSMLLGEAVEENLIGSNPCRRLRISTGDFRERQIAEPWQVTRIAQRMPEGLGLLVVTAAYTGLRWGELAALQWKRVDLVEGTVRVDPQTGALHEIGGRVELGPPKTPASVRTVHLPKFLTDALHVHRGIQDHDHVFTGAEGGVLRRSNFRHRFWLPAVAGTERRGLAPLLPGFHFHDLRHTHKTWMIEDKIPEIAQHARLGHRMQGAQGIYSHVTKVMIDDILARLSRRWEITQ
ncbi:tyrosine-type recombinase/integrase [Actinoalloteichus caeruleus]|uniref:tyrosine-type recombinase/integrase n=1 Tax=Actinoalloteichus cyanogriseus TaxID=2893586 RepID=UPI003AABF37E